MAGVDNSNMIQLDLWDKLTDLSTDHIGPLTHLSTDHIGQIKSTAITCCGHLADQLS